MIDVMLEMLEYIEGNTDYVYNDEPLPHILYVSYEDMFIMYHGRAPAENEDPNMVLGLYADDVDLMFLPEDFDIDNTRNYITLLHELVHYMQDINGHFEDPNECRGETEFEAYDLTDTYVMEYDLDKEYMTDPLWKYLIASTCHDMHYDNYAPQQEGVKCYDIDFAVDTLTERYGEYPLVTGKPAEGATVTFWYGPAENTWTVTIDDGETMCVQSSGIDVRFPSPSSTDEKS